MSNRYFIRREQPTRCDFEERYWGVVVDPDGRTRDRRTEREQFLGDAKAEIDFLRSLPPGRILDVGCGLGFLLSALDDRWEKHGVEVSRLACAHASQWGKVHCGDLPSAGYPSDFFDVVVMYHVIEHVGDPASLLKEARRVLRPRGQLVLATPDFDCGCARRFGQNYRLLHDSTHISLFTDDSMHRFLRDHGFVIERVDYPFFETRHFTEDNLHRLFDTARVSPPFYGNFVTFYCRKPRYLHMATALLRLGAVAMAELDSMEQATGSALELLGVVRGEEATLWLWGDTLSVRTLRRLVSANASERADSMQLTVREWETGAEDPAAGARDVVLMAPANADEVRVMADAARSGPWKGIAIVPESDVHEFDKCEVILPVPAMEELPAGAVQLLVTQALLLELSPKISSGTGSHG